MIKHPPKAAMLSIINKCNDSVAVKMTVIFGSIWCVYAFLLFSLTPLVAPKWQDTLLYVSNCIQLVALPALMVGSAVLNKGANERAEQDHQALLEILADVKEELADLKLRTTGLTRYTTEALQRPLVTDVSISDQTFVNLGGSSQHDAEPS